MNEEVHVLEKHTKEQRTIAWDVSQEIPEGLTTTSATAETRGEDGEDVPGFVVGSPVAVGQTVVFILAKGVGVSGMDYRVSLHVTLSNANTWAAEFLVQVRDH